MYQQIADNINKTNYPVNIIHQQNGSIHEETFQLANFQNSKQRDE